MKIEPSFHQVERIYKLTLMQFTVDCSLPAMLYGSHKWNPNLIFVSKPIYQLAPVFYGSVNICRVYTLLQSGGLPHTLPVYHLQNHASASEFTHCNASSLSSKMQFEQEEMETTFLFLANNDYLPLHIEFYSAYCCQQLISNRASNLDVHLVCITPSHLIKCTNLAFDFWKVYFVNGSIKSCLIREGR